MSKNVDTKMVQLKLDSSDFQKNAKKTQDTIKQLEKDLELKDASKGFDNITKASNKVDLSGTSSQIGSVLKKFFGLQKDATESISGITKAADKVDMSNIADAANGVADDIGQFGINGTESILSLNSAADKVDMSPIAVAVEKISGEFSMLEVAAITAVQNITNKFMDSATQWVKSMAFGDINAGWDAYAEKTKAVQVMMAATASDFEDMKSQGLVDGKQIDWVEGQMDKLAWYTDETSYNFLDMANNIGKFTNQGIGLEDATNQMIGIANWGAAAGANAQEVSRAMYNISQAMGTGAMKLVDWKSIENANMATKEFKVQVMETAVELGFLERTGEDGLYHVKNAAEDATVSFQDFNSQLSTGWFDSSVMQKVFNDFGSFSQELFELSDKMTDWGFAKSAEELMGYIDDYADNDLSFLDELASSSKWTQDKTDALLASLQELGKEEYKLSRKSFEMGAEAKTFGEAIEATHDAAKTVWGQLFQDVFGNYEKGKRLWTELSGGLWEIFVGPIKNVEAVFKKWNQSEEYDIFADGLIKAINVVTEVITTFQEAFLSVFGIGGGDSMTDSLKTWSKRVGEFLSSLELSEEGGKKIAAVARGIAKVLKGVFSISTKLLGAVGRPLMNIVGWLFQIIDSLFGVKDATDEAAGPLDKLGSVFDSLCAIIERVLNIISDLIGAFYYAFTEGASVGDTIAQLLVQPFRVIGDAILDVFSLITGKDVSGAKKGFTNFCYSIIDGIATAIDWLINLGTNIVNFFKEIPGHIQNAWQVANDWMSENLGWNIAGVFEKIGDAVSKAWTKVKDFFKKLLGLNDETGSKFQAAQEHPLVKFWHSVTDALGKVWEWLKKIPAAFDAAFQKLDAFVERATGKDIKTHFNELRESIEVTWQKVKDFFGKFSQEKAVDDSTEKVGIFSKIWSGLKRAVSAVVDWAKKAFPVIKEVFQNLWDRISPYLQRIKEGLGSIDWAELAKGGGLLAIGTALLKIVKGKKDNDDGESALDSVRGLVDQIKEAFGGLTDTLSSLQKSIKANIILKIAIAVVGLAAAMLMIASLDREQFTNGLTAISVFFAELASFFVIVDDASKSSKDIQKIAVALAIVTFAIRMLVSALVKMKDVTWDQMTVGMAAIAGLLTMFIIFTKRVNTKDAGQIVVAAAAMLIIAKAIKMLMKPLLALAVLEEAALRQGLLAVGSIFLMMAAFIKIVKDSEIAVKNSAGVLILVGAILLLVPAIKALGNMDLAALAKGIGSIIVLFAVMAGFIKVVKDTKVAVKSSVAVLVLAGAILMLVPAVKQLGAMSLPDLIKGVSAVSVLMAAVAGFLALAARSKVAIKNVVSVVAIAGAILMFVPAVKELGSMKLPDLIKGVAALSLLMAAVAGFLALAARSKVAVKNVAAIAAVTGAIVFLVDPVKQLGRMKLDQLAKGIGSIILITAALAGLLIVASKFKVDFTSVAAIAAITLAIVAMVDPIKELGALDLASLAKGVITIGVVLGLIAGFIIAINKLAGGGAGGAASIIAAAVGMVIMAGAMRLLVGVFTLCADLEWGTIGKGLLIMGGAMAVLAVGGILLKKALPGLLGFAAVIGIIGLSIMMVGVGVLKFAEGIAILAALGDSAGNVVRTLGTAFIDVLPGIIDALGEGAADLIESIVMALWNVIERILGMASTILSRLNELVPEIVGLIVNLINNIIEQIAQNSPTLFKNLGTILSRVLEMLSTLWGGIIKMLHDNWPAFWDFLTDALTDIWNYFVEWFPNLINFIFDAIFLILDKLSENIAGIIDRIVDICNKAVQTLTARLPEIIEIIFDFIMTLIVNLIDQLIKNLPTIFDKVRELLEKLLECIVDFLVGNEEKGTTGIIDTINDTILKIVKGIATAIPKFVGALLDLIILLLTSLTAELRARKEELSQALADIPILATEFAFQLVIDTLNGLATTITDNVPLVKEAMINLLDAVFKAVLEFLGIDTKKLSESELFADTGGNIIQGLINGIKNVGKGIWEKIKEPFVNMWDAVKNFFGFGDDSKQNAAEELGENLMTGLSDGITNSSGEPADAIGAASEEVVNRANATFDTHSPSRVFAGIGDNVMAGLSEGIKNFNSGGGGLWGSVSGFFSGLISNVKGLFGIHSPSTVFAGIGENLDLGLANGITDNADVVNDSAAEMGAGAMSAVQEAISGATNSVGNDIGEPVITPVLDLSEIQNGTTRLSSMLDFSDASVGAKLGLFSGDQVGNIASGFFGGSSSGSGDGGTVINQPVNFTINAAEGQDVNAIANAVERMLTKNVNQRGYAFR